MNGISVLFWLIFLLALLYVIRNGYLIVFTLLVIVGFVMFIGMYYESDYSFWSDPILEEYLYERIYHDIDSDIRDSMSRREKKRMRRKIRNLLREDYGGKLTEEQYSRFSQRIRNSMHLVNKKDKVVVEPATPVSNDDTPTPPASAASADTPTPPASAASATPPASADTPTPPASAASADTPDAASAASSDTTSYADALKNAQNKLTDAQNKLTDAQNKLANAQNKLANAQKELEIASTHEEKALAKNNVLHATTLVQSKNKEVISARKAVESAKNLLKKIQSTQNTDVPPPDRKRGNTKPPNGDTFEKFNLLLFQNTTNLKNNPLAYTLLDVGVRSLNTYHELSCEEKRKLNIDYTNKFKYIDFDEVWKTACSSRYLSHDDFNSNILSVLSNMKIKESDMDILHELPEMMYFHMDELCKLSKERKTNYMMNILKEHDNLMCEDKGNQWNMKSKDGTLTIEFSGKNRMDNMPYDQHLMKEIKNLSGNIMKNLKAYCSDEYKNDYLYGILENIIQDGNIIINSCYKPLFKQTIIDGANIHTIIAKEIFIDDDTFPENIHELHSPHYERKYLGIANRELNKLNINVIGYNEQEYHQDFVYILKKIYGQKMNLKDREHAYNSIKNIVDNIIQHYKDICNEDRTIQLFSFYKLIVKNTIGVICPITDSEISDYFMKHLNMRNYDVIAN